MRSANKKAGICVERRRGSRRKRPQQREICNFPHLTQSSSSSSSSMPTSAASNSSYVEIACRKAQGGRSDDVIAGCHPASLATSPKLMGRYNH